MREDGSLIVRATLKRSCISVDNDYLAEFEGVFFHQKMSGFSVTRLATSEHRPTPQVWKRFASVFVPS